jgi:hypothetical protein
MESPLLSSESYLDVEDNNPDNFINKVNQYYKKQKKSYGDRIPNNINNKFQFIKDNNNDYIYQLFHI